MSCPAAVPTVSAFLDLLLELRNFGPNFAMYLVLLVRNRRLTRDLDRFLSRPCYRAMRCDTVFDHLCIWSI